MSQSWYVTGHTRQQAHTERPPLEVKEVGTRWQHAVGWLINRAPVLRLHVPIVCICFAASALQLQCPLAEAASTYLPRWRHAKMPASTRYLITKKQRVSSSQPQHLVLPTLVHFHSALPANLVSHEKWVPVNKTYVSRDPFQ